MSIITLKMEAPFSPLKVMKEVGVLTIEHSWTYFRNDYVFKVKGMQLGWIFEFYFMINEPCVAIFKRGWWHVWNSITNTTYDNIKGTTNNLHFSTYTIPLKQQIGWKTCYSTHLNCHSQQSNNQCSSFALHFFFFSLCRIVLSFPLCSFHVYFIPSLSL